MASRVSMRGVDSVGFGIAYLQTVGNAKALYAG